MTDIAIFAILAAVVAGLWWRDKLIQSRENYLNVLRRLNGQSH